MLVWKHAVLMWESCIRCPNWSKDYFCSRVLFSSHRNIFLLLLLRSSWCWKCDVCSKHSLHIKKFNIVLIFSVKYTLLKNHKININNSSVEILIKNRHGNYTYIICAFQKISCDALGVEALISVGNKWHKSFNLWAPLLYK